MNKRSLGALIVLNLMLLAAVAVVNLSPAPAAAQGFGTRGNYVMLAGTVTGRANQSAVYVVELNTARMMVVFFNASTNNFEFVASRDVAGDARSGGGGGPGR